MAGGTRVFDRVLQVQVRHRRDEVGHGGSPGEGQLCTQHRGARRHPWAVRCVAHVVLMVGVAVNGGGGGGGIIIVVPPHSLLENLHAITER